MFLMFLPPLAPPASVQIKSNKIVIKPESPQQLSDVFDGFKMGSF